MKAVIFDLDRTILYHTNRSPFNWTDLSGDMIIPEVRTLMEMLYNQKVEIIFVTGRPERVRVQTEAWLNKHLPNITYLLYMKEGNPNEHGYVTKEQTLMLIQQGGYEVMMAFDDDQKCAEMYVRNNIITMVPLNYRV